jgi:type IX secretion system PorP/SprF family membrane protein
MTARSAQAQEIHPPVAIDYYQQELYINPAVTGSYEHVSSTVSINRQWLDIEGSPGVQRLQVHSPFASGGMGLGLTVQRQSYGVANNLNFGLNYAYHIRMERGRLSFGLCGNAVTMQENLSEAITIVEDHVFSSNSKLLWGFNFGAGAYYSTEKFYLGLSLPAMFGNSIKHDGNFESETRLDLSQSPVYFTAGYVVNVSEMNNMKLKPHLLAGYSSDYKWVYNAGVTAFFHDRYWIGINARYRSEIGASAGIRLMRVLNLGYAFTTGSLNMPYTYRGLSHEIKLNVLLGKKAARMVYF